MYKEHSRQREQQCRHFGKECAVVFENRKDAPVVKRSKQ